MKKVILALSLMGLLLVGQNALAVDTDGKFGIGGNASLSQQGVTGLGLNYWVGHLKVGAITGFSMVSPSEGDSTTNMSVALHGLYAVARSKEANLNTGLRINMRDLIASGGAEGAAEQDMTLGFEVPIEAEFWVTEHVTITAHVGLSIDMPTDTTIISLGGPGFNGGAGFNFYF